MKNFDLQTFADADSSATFNYLNPNTTGSEGLSAEMKAYYDRDLISVASAQLVHDQFAQKRNIPKNGGKTVEFRKFEPLGKATTPLTEGVTPKGQSFSVTNFDATVSQYGNYVTISDVLDLTAIDNNILEVTKLLGTQAGVSLDAITRNKIHSGTNVIYVPNRANGSEEENTSRNTINGTAILTVKDIQRAVRSLKRQNAPKIDGYYIAIIHPDVAFDLMRDPEWISVKNYDSADWYQGEIGKIAGVRFVESSEAMIYKDRPNESAVYGTLVFGADAYGTTEVEGGGLKTIIKQLGSAGSGDPLDQRATVGWKALKTATILVEPYLVRIESSSSNYANAEANE